MAITQDERLIAVTTPLGKDALVLTSFAGREVLSRPFSYHLEMFSEDDTIDPTEIVGQNVTWCVQDRDPPRFFNGFVSRLAAGPLRGRKVRTYSAEVVPWLWFLTRTSDCRIFQNQTVPQIIEAVFDGLGFSDYEPKLRQSYDKREYCVQYCETDFNFVSRLMEEEGIFYFFRHEDGKHTLVLADQKSGYEDVPE
jgi:type VI secretion system secreted protein VgrG